APHRNAKPLSRDYEIGLQIAVEIHHHGAACGKTVKHVALVGVVDAVAGGAYGQVGSIAADLDESIAQLRAAVEDGHIGAGHSIRQNAPEISRNAEVESLGVKSVAGYKDVEFSPRTARAGGDADGAGLRLNVGKRSARNVPVPVSGDGDDRRGHGGAVAQVSHFSRRRVHAKPTSADMPVGTGLIMAAGKGEAFYVACIPGAVVARGTAQYSQTRDRDSGAAKHPQN